MQNQCGKSSEKSPDSLWIVECRNKINRAFANIITYKIEITIVPIINSLIIRNSVI